MVDWLDRYLYAMSLYGSKLEPLYTLIHWPTGWFYWHFRWVISIVILVIDDWYTSCEIAIRLMQLDLTDDKSTLVQVMALRQQAITWASVNQDPWRHMVSLGHNELIWSPLCQHPLYMCWMLFLINHVLWVFLRARYWQYVWASGGNYMNSHALCQNTIFQCMIHFEKLYQQIRTLITRPAHSIQLQISTRLSANTKLTRNWPQNITVAHES